MELFAEHTKVYRELCKSRKYFYVVNEGGTRSSKTWSLLTYFLFRCISNPNQGKVFQVFRKTLTSCNRTVMRDFIEVVDKFELWNYVRWNKTSSTFIVNGNTIEFCGADQAQKLRGAKRWVVWLNEANELSEEDFKQLKLRTEAQMFFDYNPSFTDHWLYKMIEIEASESEDTKILSSDIMKICGANNGVYTGGRVKLIQSTYKDNPLLSKEIVINIEKLKLYDDDDYNIYALGIRSNPAGLMFKRSYYSKFDVLPEHRIGLIYCDPNLSLKGKGDTTAIVKLYYSPTTGLFYIDKVVCKSFNNTNDLLDEVLNFYSDDCRYIGFDGNFSQESTWTQHIQNYAAIKGLPFPFVEFKRYRVDEISKTVQYLWNTKQILFNESIENNEDGNRFLSQVYQFNGKKNTVKGTQDDAPDAMICSINFMYDLNFVTNNEVQNLIKTLIKRA